MGNILGVPVTYGLRRSLRNEDGFSAGIKEVVAYSHVERYQRKKKKRFDFYEPYYSEKYDEMGLLIPKFEEDLEHQRPLPKYDLKAKDSIFFCGFNSLGEKLVVKITRNGSGLASVWLHLKLSNGKTYSLPQSKEYRFPKTGKETFAAGGLRLRCLFAMRKWRLAFSGILREEDSVTMENRNIYVKFCFIWTASTHIFDIASDITSSQWAKYMSGQQWNGYAPDITRYCEDIDSYVQGGDMTGTVQVEDGEEEVKHLWGSRKRTFELNTNCNKPTIETEYFAYMTEGEMLYFASTRNEISRPLQFGYIVMANSKTGAIDALKIEGKEDSKTVIQFAYDIFSWTASFGKPSYQTNNEDFQERSVFKFCPVSLTYQDSEVDGSGLIISSTNVKTSQTSSELGGKIYLPLLDVVLDKHPLILSLQDPVCRHSDISGGKGSSLADLHVISNLDKSFSVPTGVVVTTTAYELFVQHCHLEGMLDRLQMVSGKLQPKDFQKECERVSTSIMDHPLPLKIKEALRTELVQVLGTHFEDIKVAVRSSASGEDSEEMSAAGQMKTFLGVKGMREISESVVNCWASQFDYIACQYKRQNGQLLNSPMAVVVQEMVDADVAGVMFTCDPVTGNPSRITITANYGIGESVVSATADPDTIMLKRSLEGQLEILSVAIGQKSVMTVLKDAGVTDKSVSKDDSSRCSLSDDLTLKLSKLGVLIEEAYGCLIDIEWAIKNNRFFLLQARPVTTSDKETNFEIKHETDNSYRTEKEWYTTGNVGEVMPGAISNLGMSSVNRFCFQILFMRSWGRRSKEMFPYCPYYLRGFGSFASHMMFNVIDNFLRYYYGKHTMVTNSQMISTIGRILEDEDLLKRAVYRNRFYKPVYSPLVLYHLLNDMYNSGSHLRKNLEKYQQFVIDINHLQTAQEMYTELFNQWLSLTVPFNCLFECSFYSSFANIALFSILVAANDGKWNQDVYNDVAYVLSSCYQVESADVPLALERLSKIIFEDYGPDFGTLETREALMWLERTDSPSGSHFAELLKRHGHRCVKEFDLYSKPWGSDPLPLVQIIQDIVSRGDQHGGKKELVSTKDTIKNIKSQLSWKHKFLMKYIIPLCRAGVGYREGSKSLMIGLVNSLRGAYRQLGERMVLEGYLPSADLLYFLEHFEVVQLLQTRSPKLIQKATRRRNMFAEIDKIILPEFMEGFPQPINFDEKQIVVEGSLCVKGVPVSQGVATGRARVATNIKEAAGIQQGEILIAYSTDIGWSPYFPMLAGVVTELGGLISHGAVVAREYGLPCIVAAQGATRQFKTGDLVQIDGNKGTIIRLDE